MLILLTTMTSLASWGSISTMVNLRSPFAAYSMAVSQAERPPPQMTTFLPSGMPFLWICSTSMAFSMPGMAGMTGLEPVATNTASADSSTGSSTPISVFSTTLTPSFLSWTSYHLMSCGMRHLKSPVAMVRKVPPRRSAFS